MFFIREKQKKVAKFGGKAYIIKEEVTDKHWQDHIAGVDPSLGIIPIRDDSNCIWSCIDVDDYTIDVRKTIQAYNKLNLPIIPCRSKSGGFHLFLFYSEPVPAKSAIKKLTEIASVLGFADCEIFPKQEFLNVDRGDTGNFLNLPYFKGDMSGRYAMNEKGQALTLDAFFNLVNQKAITHDQLKNLSVRPLKQKKLPLMALHASKFSKIWVFSKDRGMMWYFIYCVYAKKKYGPGEWQNKVMEFNAKYCQPPMSYDQVKQKIDQHEKKDYGYKCKDVPMRSHCDNSKCRVRKFGIGRDDVEMNIANLTKLESDESVWHLDVDGQRITVTTDELMDQRLFRKKVLETHTSLPIEMSKRDYEARIRELLEQCEIIKMPKEVTKEGRFYSHLEDFVYNQAIADDIEDVLKSLCVEK